MAKADEEKAARARQSAARKGQGTKSRKSFEAANPERMTGMAALNGREIQINGRTHTMSGWDKVSPKEAYRAMGWHEHDAAEGANNVHQGTLFDDPRMVKNPKRWEDMQDRDRARVTSKLAEHGITMESATKSMGARIDQAMIREDGKHANFYSTESEHDGVLSPRSRMKKSAEEIGLPLHLHMRNNALTSPQNTFVHVNKATGEVRYPNDDAAKMAGQMALEGKSGEDYVKHPDFYVPPEEKTEKVTKSGRRIKEKAEGDPRKYPVQGYPANMAKAIDQTRAVLDGKPLGKVAGPKEGPYHNAWVDPRSPEGNFSVGDTHAFEAAAPHLAQNDVGKKKEAAVTGIVGWHAFQDHAQRQAMAARGLSSVNRTQSATWNQTKLDEGHNDVDSALTFRSSKQFKPKEIYGQGALF